MLFTKNKNKVVRDNNYDNNIDNKDKVMGSVIT